MRKNYVLDANILLHDPNCIFHFADNTVIIPVAVIGEIDRFKKEMTDRGHNARAVVRLLDALRGQNSLAAGVQLEGGGRLVVHCEPERVLTASNGHADLELLRVAQAIRQREPDVPVVIVTKDINLRIRADAAGLRAEDYESDHVALSDVYAAQAEHVVAAELLDELSANGSAPIVGLALHPNQYVLLRSAESRGTVLARADARAETLLALRQVDKGLWGIKPRNKEQYFAIDALLDDALPLVSLLGRAGTGKTLLAVAAGMHLTLRQKRYRGLLIGRPIFPLGRDLGYLPGDIEEKLDPWMKPIVDAVEFLLARGGTKHEPDAAALIKSGLIEIQPLTYIRGRSISNRFVIIDEAQNLTPLEVKTVITRIGHDAKIVLTGDPYQIDNPYVDANSNGLSYVAQRFQAQPVAAHVELTKGERSTLAELAANLL